MNKLSQFKTLSVLHIDVFLSITFGSANPPPPTHIYIYIHVLAKLKKKFINIAQSYFYLLFKRDGKLIFP